MSEITMTKIPKGADKTMVEINGRLFIPPQQFITSTNFIRWNRRNEEQIGNVSLFLKVLNRGVIGLPRVPPPEEFRDLYSRLSPSTFFWVDPEKLDSDSGLDSEVELEIVGVVVNLDRDAYAVGPKFVEVVLPKTVFTTYQNRPPRNELVQMIVSLLRYTYQASYLSLGTKGLKRPVPPYIQEVGKVLDGLKIQVREISRSKEEGKESPAGTLP